MIAAVSFLVRDYDEAIEFFTTSLGFTLRADTALGHGKRWVLVAPPGASGTGLLLAKAVSAEQLACVGKQSGGRVFLFLNSTNFQHDYARMQAAGVQFLENPRHEPYGTVAVFVDLYGNKWDLIQPNS